MIFSPNFLENEFFENHALSFDRPSGEIISGKPLDTGAHLKENGDYEFRIYAPDAEDVRISLWWNKEPLVLSKDENGVFEGIYPYNPRLTGPVGLSLYVDGALFLSPWIPIFWTGGRPCNYIEVPDPEMDFAMIRNVPHGSLAREIYYAKNLGRYERCLVYTPPGYMNGEETYPVLYLLNGFSDNEISWEYAANVSSIMDNGIASGKIREFIVVMNNGMLRYPESDGKMHVWDLALEDLLLGSCIPYIENTYRVYSEKWMRAIGGLSMGAYQSNDIGFRHGDVFGSIGQFTASITHKEAQRTYKQKYKEALSDPAGFAETYRVFFRSTTPNEDHFEYFEADDRIYHVAGVDLLPCYTRKVYPDGTSRWKSWRMGLRDYAELLFR